LLLQTQKENNTYYVKSDISISQILNKFNNYGNLILDVTNKAEEILRNEIYLFKN